MDESSIALAICAGTLSYYEERAVLQYAPDEAQRHRAHRERYEDAQCIGDPAIGMRTHYFFVIGDEEEHDHERRRQDAVDHRRVVEHLHRAQGGEIYDKSYSGRN